MSKINRTEDLPEWFCLDHYKGAESFGAVGWYEQLAQRGYLIILQQYCRDDPLLASKAKTSFERDIQYIRGINVENARIPNFFGAAGLSRYLTDEKRSVHSLTFRHLVDHARNMEGCYDDPSKWFASMNHECIEGNLTEPTEDPALFLTGHLTGTKEQFAAVRVDLDAPDAMLLESFSLWLAEARKLKASHRDKKYYRPNFQRWARYGLLPYIDLSIWAMETRTNIPDRVLSAAISSYDAGESNVRKTIAPLAEALINDLSELRALAAIEAAAKFN